MSDTEAIKEPVAQGNGLSAAVLADPEHPANVICRLCAHFYTLGWVTGTGGGMSVRQDGQIYLAPTGVQKELIGPTDIFVLAEADAAPRDAQGRRVSHHAMAYLLRPAHLRPSACTPLFLTAFRLRGAGCCIHTHSHWAVLVTLLVEKAPGAALFEIEQIEQIKGIPSGRGKQGNLGYYDRLRVPIIENTALEENLTDSLEQAMLDWPDTYAVLVRRHGIYVWGEDVARAKTICESLDYLFRLAVEMHQLGLPWTGAEPASVPEVRTPVNGSSKTASPDSIPLAGSATSPIQAVADTAAGPAEQPQQQQQQQQQHQRNGSRSNGSTEKRRSIFGSLLKKPQAAS